MKNPNAAEVLDSELVARVQAGDKTAFDLLVLKYQHRIVQLVYRYIKDPVEAQDVAQEAFIKAYRALPEFRGESAFFTWLYRIAVNAAKNHLDLRNRRPGDDADLDVDDAEQIASIGRLKSFDTPERILLSEEMAETILAAFDDLSEDLRTAISLRELEGMSYEEIAEVMQCPVGTVRSRIFRAREAIDQRLRPLLD